MTVIHASSSENTMNAQIYSGLSDDTLIATSTSAYNSQDIFYEYIIDFQKQTKVSSAIIYYSLLVIYLFDFLYSMHIYIPYVHTVLTSVVSLDLIFIIS
jgi:hypothetical protein